MKNLIISLLVLCIIAQTAECSALRSMKRAAFGTTNCGRQADRLQPSLGNRNRIIGGFEAKKNSWPWMLKFSYEHDNGRTEICGANLIRVSTTKEESDIVVTAAHCVVTPGNTETGGFPVNRSIDKMSYRAGAHYQYNITPETEQARGVANVAVHPDFKFGNMDNDIAVVKLDQPVEFTDFVKPICLPAVNAAIPTTLQCVAAGWGRNDSQDSTILPDFLKQVTLPVQSAQTCSSKWPGKMYNEATKLCAGEIGDETSSVCTYDSGSQLACRKPESNDPWVLYGTTSFLGSTRCVSANMKPVFVRVSNYLAFIEEQANALTNVK